MELEEVELAAELTVVALLGLFEPPEVLVELFLGQPRGAVDALEHRVLLAPAPVRARGREELEEPDRPRRGHVRPAAEIHEVALAVERDRGRVDAAQDLDLEGLAALLEEADRLVARHLLAGEGQVLLRQLAHPGLDLLEVLGREWRGLREIVVEAVLDGRADGDLDLGEDLRDGLGHQMRRRVAECRQRLRGAVRLPGELEVPIFFGVHHVCAMRPVLETKKHHGDCAR